MRAAAGERWSDLGPRVISALALALVCGGAVWLGGWWMRLLVGAVIGLAIWELTAIVGRDRVPSAERVPTAILAGLVAVIADFLPGVVRLPVLVAGALATAGIVRQDRVVLGSYGFAVIAAGSALISIRLHGGLEIALWLIAVVVLTDIAGYFGGRLIGGPKFWPRVSPNKTWSGILCGWAVAALVGWAFAGPLAAGWGLIVFSVATSLASQIGDIVESAIKRRAGVKDTSEIIPGHGGFLDRFDGLIGGALFVWIVMALSGWPVAW